MTEKNASYQQRITPFGWYRDTQFILICKYDRLLSSRSETISPVKYLKKTKKTRFIGA